MPTASAAQPKPYERTEVQYIHRQHNQFFVQWRMKKGKFHRKAFDSKEAAIAHLLKHRKDLDKNSMLRAAFMTVKGKTVKGKTVTAGKGIGSISRHRARGKATAKPKAKAKRKPVAPTISSAQVVPEPKKCKPPAGVTRPPAGVTRPCTCVRAIRSAGRLDQCSKTLQMLLSMDPAEVWCFVPAAERDSYAEKLRGLSVVIVADNEGPSEVVTAMCKRALKLDGDVHLVVHDDNLASWRP